MSHSHLNYVHSIPMLEEDEEKKLWAEYKSEETGALRKKMAADKLAGAYLRFVLKHAKKRKNWADIDDLFGEGSEGLAAAIERFDPSRGVKFATYASYWIKAFMQQHIIKNRGLFGVGMGIHGKFLFYNYRKMKKQVTAKKPHLPENLIDDHIADLWIKLGKNREDSKEKLLKVIGAYKEKMHTRGISVDLPIGNDDVSMTFGDVIADDAPNAEDNVIKEDERTLAHKFFEVVHGHFQTIGRERLWDIYYRRSLQEPRETLEAIGIDHGISKERVRQLSVRAAEIINDHRKEFKAAALSGNYPPPTARLKKAEITFIEDASQKGNTALKSKEMPRERSPEPVAV